MAKDKDRVIALQKQVRLARSALDKAVYGDLSGRAAEECLDEMNKVEWASKPNLVQEPPRYLTPLKRAY